MVNLASAAKRVGTAFRQADILNLALLLELLHSFHRFFDRRLPVKAVGIVEVDMIHTQALERLLAGLPAVFGAAVNMALAFSVTPVGKFRC